jgi:hypothetical protein
MCLGGVHTLPADLSCSTCECRGIPRHASYASPFPPYWWGIGLEECGLGSVRPDLGTYACYPYEQLPPIPFILEGDFGWLAAEQPREGHLMEDERADANADAWPKLQQAVRAHGLQLPGSLVRFFDSPALQQRVRSCTACYLDVCAQLIPSPLDGGHLLRFLADQQSVLFWYLHLNEDGSDHAVVCSPGFYGTEQEQWQDEPPDPEQLVFCAESFEIFMARFWLENELWFAATDQTPYPKGGREYVGSYLARAP